MPLSLFLVFLAVQSVAWGRAPIATAPADVEMEPVLAAGHALFLQDGDLYALKADAKSPLPVRKRGTGHTRIVSPAAMRVGSRLAVAWIERSSDGNALYAVTAPDDGRFELDPRPLASGTTSSSVQLVNGPGDVLYLLDVAAGENPKLSISRSVDAGRSFVRTPVPLDRFQQLHLVSAIHIDSRLYLFLHGVHQGRSVIATTAYDAEQRTVLGTEIITEIPSTSLIQALAIQGTPALLYKRYQDRQFSLNMARQDNRGWHSTQIPGTDNLDVARLDRYVWKDGRVLVVFSGEQRGRSKQRVYAALSKDAGARWQTTQLDGAEHDNTRAWLPRLAVSGEHVAVVWEDARQIRSRIRMQVSGDRGDSWLDRDTPISDVSNYAMRPSIGTDGAELHLTWLQYVSDARETLEVALLTLKWEELLAGMGRTGSEIPVKEKEAQLRRQVEDYWKAMMENDQQATYQAHDPFYRARVPFLQYAANRGPIVYHRYEVKALAIQGNEARVEVALTYSVPKLKAMGAEKSIAPRDFTVRDTWLFMDGTWQRKFVDAMSGGSAIRY